MCCLFGLIDYRHTLTAKQKSRMISALAVAAEARGTDATGIAYNSGGKLHIFKRPLPAHCMRFHIPEDTAVVMGHTRMTTQGSARRNRNNHPFLGHTDSGDFAFAHNGFLYNDAMLRRSQHLPRTRIETDSYIGVQLLEQKKALNFDSLRYMAELVEGSFSFTILDRRDGLWIVKGDSPMCLYHFPKLGVYVYASTEEILKKALGQVRFPGKQINKINLDCGELLWIDAQGTLTRSQFDDSNLCCWYEPLWRTSASAASRHAPTLTEDDTYLDEIKSVAAAFGYTPESIDRLANLGFTPEELEELLYCGEL